MSVTNHQLDESNENWPFSVCSWQIFTDFYVGAKYTTGLNFTTLCLSAYVQGCLESFL